jgi:excisionase family DNA binding protein
LTGVVFHPNSAAASRTTNAAVTAPATIFQKLFGMTLPLGEHMERATYTVAEVAAILGVNHKGVYDAIKRGEIRALKIGGRIVVPRLVIEAMLRGDEQ